MNKKYNFYAEGGSLDNHGLKEGDQIIKTMFGGVQKVKTKTGDIVYVNLANGYRGAEPPLPFAKGGEIEFQHSNLTIVGTGIDKNGNRVVKVSFPNQRPFSIQTNGNLPKTHSLLKDYDKKNTNFYKGEIESMEDEILDYIEKYGSENQKKSVRVYGSWLNKDDYAKGGGVRKVGNREYSTGRNWTNDHRHVNKSEQHEVNYNRRNSLFFAGGGEIRRFDRQAQMDSETREEILDVLSESDTPKVLTNYLYGLFDGYDYSETANFKKEVEFLKRKNPKLHQRVVDIYKKIDKYKFEKYQDNYANGGGFGNGYVKSYYNESISGGDNGYQVNLMFYKNLDDEDYFDEEYITTSSPKKAEELSERINKLGYEGFLPMNKYANGGVTKNYVQRKQLNTITIKKGDQKLTYKVSDVYNGAYKLEDGGKLEKLAFYVAKRNVVKVQLRDGKDVKVANGYWIKKGAKPIHTSKYDDGGFMADVYADGGGVYHDSKYLTKEQWEKWNDYVKTGKINGKKVDNIFTVARHIGVPVAKINSYNIEQRAKGNFADGGSLGNKEPREEDLITNIGKYGSRITKVTDSYVEFYDNKSMKMVSCKKSDLVLNNIDDDGDDDGFYEDEPNSWICKKNYEGGGKTTFKQKATAIAKNFEGKKVKPKYQKEYGKTYDKAEAKEVGNKIAGSQKAKYDSKMSGGGKTKRGGAMQLAKQIRKDGESWQSALKRANEQVRNK